MEQPETQQPASRIHLRGFGTMKLKDPARLFALQSAAGKAAHAKGTAHEFTSEEAVAAGRKGGISRRAKKQEVAA